MKVQAGLELIPDLSTGKIKLQRPSGSNVFNKHLSTLTYKAQRTQQLDKSFIMITLLLVRLTKKKRNDWNGMGKDHNNKKEGIIQITT